MARQPTEVDRLLGAWAALVRALTADWPGWIARLRAVRARLTAPATRRSRML